MIYIKLHSASQHDGSYFISVYCRVACFEKNVISNNDIRYYDDNNTQINKLCSIKWLLLYNANEAVKNQKQTKTGHLLSFLWPYFCGCIYGERKKYPHSNVSPLLLSLIWSGSWVAIDSRFCCKVCCMILCCSSATINILFSGDSLCFIFSLICSWATAWMAIAVCVAMAAEQCSADVKGRVIRLGRQLAFMGSSGKNNNEYMCKYKYSKMI